MSPDRRAVALHEAGHAVAAVVLGQSFEYASIRPGRTFAGIVVGFRRSLDGADEFDPSEPVARQPAEVRRSVETSILIDLAGDLAKLLLIREPAGEYADDGAERIAEAALNDLGSRALELVAEHEGRTEVSPTDEHRAIELSLAFIGQAPSLHYLAWLRAEAETLVIQYAPAILRVADALERRAILSGDGAVALVHPPRSEI